MKYLLAVSGGPDSMAMLDMYHKKAQAVCVVDYQKRENSQKDVEIVQEYCSIHNIKCYVHKVDKKIYQMHKKDNFQSLARQIRYNFFAEMAKKEQNNHFLIAHNLNDHFETAYMQFNRNSKALFYGIARKNEVFGLKINRPLLRYKKSTLQRYCDQKGIKYVIDYTNNENIYERNKVRKIINGWNNDELIKFRKKINSYNKQNKKMSKELKKQYQIWASASYPLNMLLKQDNEMMYHLIYQFLHTFGEKNNSCDKISSIQQFLMSSGSKKKKYRLENNRYLVISDNILKIL